MTFLLALVRPFLPYIIAGGVVLAAVLGWGEKRYWDGRSDYKAKIEREIAKAVKKGDTARAKALEDFDKSEEVPDDGFARD